ncbi:MAG TPA: efflux RND transporter periplasmic adaptor subunit [Rhodospirillaceae bacterium]|nr:efflux RND transporter periplasmic adaptor subunit [Rhodospirillaceae bacterium]
MIFRSFAVTLALSLLAGLPAVAQQPAAPPVTVSKPLQKDTVDWQDYTGQFAPVENVELRSRVSGYLTEIHFTDGQMVTKGDLLLVIDPRPYENAAASARATVAQATASVELAKRQLARGGELRQKDFLAASDYDIRLQQEKVAEANLDVARASARDAELNLSFTHITAPVSGRIGAHQVSIGNLITGGGANGAAATLLATIVSLDPLYFNFDMSESDYLKLQSVFGAGLTQAAEAGKLPVDFSLSSGIGWRHQGHIDFFDNQINRGTGTIRVRASIDNHDGMVTPGAFGRLRVPSSRPYTALLVPESAVVTDQSRKVVMTVTEDGSVVPKAIVPGPVAEGLQVVKSGLGPDDQVIINGLMRVRPGAKVTPQPGSIAADPQMH